MTYTSNLSLLTWQKPSLTYFCKHFHIFFQTHISSHISLDIHRKTPNTRFSVNLHIVLQKSQRRLPKSSLLSHVPIQFWYSQGIPKSLDTFSSLYLGSFPFNHWLVSLPNHGGNTRLVYEDANTTRAGGVDRHLAKEEVAASPPRHAGRSLLSERVLECQNPIEKELGQDTMLELPSMSVLGGCWDTSWQWTERSIRWYKLDGAWLALCWWTGWSPATTMRIK